MSPRSASRFAALLLLCPLLTSCVDTELGLEVVVTSADVIVTGTAEGDALSVDLTLNVRVGTYALAGNDFIVPRAGLFADGDPVGELNLERPADFSGTLAPGESTTVRIMGSAPADAFPAARSALCEGAAIEVLVTWQADTRPDDPTDDPVREMGNAAGTGASSCD